MRHAFLFALLALSACSSEPTAPPTTDGGAVAVDVVGDTGDGLPIGQFSRGACEFTGDIAMMLTHATPDLGAPPPWASITDVSARQDGAAWELYAQGMSGIRIEIYPDRTLRRAGAQWVPIVDRPRGRVYYLRLVQDHAGPVTRDGFGLRATIVFELSQTGIGAPTGTVTVTFTAQR